ncbi:putative ubiquinone menaquinone biosynthesis-related protein [Lasiodiplodia theobromae]|uniref:Methyltransferase OMS1 n=1 Tax=Lasiodiplodia theobromae TaxID=45133 RepID=A0A5N5DG95_9PEZI|nr:Methyltransferase mitochondrial precursor [Lasiodiplodia theobromae]KAB2575994.1 Methyltransferase OMS1 [Lasiodiplodia theobromae]KAF4545034.1 Methyltransferase mitochondrial precursor [Lasiodiplodia theobromae]KAF9631690.1 putative ubiquinone menaquinone biosynthesis-related protein [Lasiodiplodia theobromae]
MGSKPAAPPPPKKGPAKAAKSPSPKPQPLAYAPRARAPRLQAAQAAINAAKPPPPLPRSRRVPLIGACFVGAGIAFYFGSVGYSMLNPYQPTHPVPADVSDRYDRTAATYDEEIGATEKTLGLNRLRKKMARQASGDVLEVSAGTGRNTRFYNWEKVRSLVLLDQSAPMLEVAKTKWEELKREKEIRNKQMVGPREKIGSVEFRAQSAFDPIEGPRLEKALEKGEEAGRFDTIVQTMGLCSTAEPEKLLQRMEDVLKKDGRILLLEHGRASHNWLNNFLDKAAPGHADKHGCWWNKDIGAIVENSGLEVVQISRPWYHLGTTWWVELRKSQKAQAEAAQRKSLEGGGKERDGSDRAAGKGGWFGGWRSS